MKIFKMLMLVYIFAGLNALAQVPNKPRAENVFLVLVDGLRWQEVFTGADSMTMNKAHGGVADSMTLKKNYWRDPPEARREALMPFLWQVVAKHGQLYGNQKKGSIVKVTNTFHFSYPGYSEMIVGYADTAINSNAKR
ncbi:MAG: AP protein, partial [candidate division KSB1 bacterium]|nr:AP protein [candidate division KSB1 bacterium]